MKWLKYSITIIILSLMLNLFSASSVYAQDNLTPTRATLFTLDTCPHCDSVKEYIAENSIDELIELDILEVSEEQNNLIYQAAINTCGKETTSVPLLFSEGICFVAYSPVKQELGRLAGITSTVVTEETVEEEVTELPDEAAPTNDVDDSTGSTKLSDRLKENTYEAQGIGLKDTLLILIPLTLFGVITYLLITKMKL